jgi:alcohol dehydrogenase class IV
LAYASLLAGYAVGTTGFAIHHATCQTIVRRLGTPHAETNAVMLPRSIAFMADRAPIEIGLVTMALGDPGGDPALASSLMSRLALQAGPASLVDLGADPEIALGLTETIARHPAVVGTPPEPPTEDEVRRYLESALE